MTLVLRIFSRRVLPAGSVAMQSVNVPPVSIHNCQAAEPDVGEVEFVEARGIRVGASKV
jgi:hypothetical protein